MPNASIQIRRGVFETNSSSTHSVSLSRFLNIILFIKQEDLIDKPYIQYEKDGSGKYKLFTKEEYAEKYNYTVQNARRMSWESDDDFKERVTRHMTHDKRIIHFADFDKYFYNSEDCEESQYFKQEQIVEIADEKYIIITINGVEGYAEEIWD